LINPIPSLYQQIILAFRPVSGSTDSLRRM